MYEKITGDIRVTVTPQYLDDQSEPEDNRFVWAYHVEIENLGEQTVQLINRYWNITDARGHVQEVQGVGVVGEQPTIEPGDSFSYTSGTPLSTASGIMMGRYGMQDDAGHRFDIDVPAFSLDSPHQAISLN